MPITPNFSSVQIFRHRVLLCIKHASTPNFHKQAVLQHFSETISCLTGGHAYGKLTCAIVVSTTVSALPIRTKNGRGLRLIYAPVHLSPASDLNLRYLRVFYSSVAYLEKNLVEVLATKHGVAVSRLHLKHASAARSKQMRRHKTDRFFISETPNQR